MEPIGNVTLSYAIGVDCENVLFQTLAMMEVCLHDKPAASILHRHRRWFLDSLEGVIGIGG